MSTSRTLTFAPGGASTIRIRANEIEEVWVLADNSGAVAFYTACRFEIDQEQPVYMSYRTVCLDGDESTHARDDPDRFRTAARTRSGHLGEPSRSISTDAFGVA